MQREVHEHDEARGLSPFLRRKRYERGLTQGELARMIGRSQALVGRWETQMPVHWLPPADVLFRLSEVLQIPPVEFFFAAYPEAGGNDGDRDPRGVLARIRLDLHHADFPSGVHDLITTFLSAVAVIIEQHDQLPRGDGERNPL